MEKEGTIDRVVQHQRIAYIRKEMSFYNPLFQFVFCCDRSKIEKGIALIGRKDIQPMFIAKNIESFGFQRP